MYTSVKFYPTLPKALKAGSERILSLSYRGYLISRCLYIPTKNGFAFEITYSKMTEEK